MNKVFVALGLIFLLTVGGNGYGQDVLQQIAVESCECIEEIGSEDLTLEQADRELVICYSKYANKYEKELKKAYQISFREFINGAQSTFADKLTSYLLVECPAYADLVRKMAPAVKARQDIAGLYDENVIYLYGENRYFKNGETFKLKKLDAEFQYSNNGYREYLKYQKKAVQGNRLMLFTLAAYVVAATQIRKNNVLAAGLGIAGFSANLVAIPVFGKSKKHLQRSVWLRNKDEIMRGYKAKR